LRSVSSGTSPEQVLDQVDLTEVAMQVRDGDGRQKDPNRQSALAPDRVVMLRAAVHFGPKARRLVLGVTRVVSRYVRNVIEHRLAGRAQPGQRVVVDGVGIAQQERQLEPGGGPGSLLQLKTCADPRQGERAARPGFAPDEFRYVPDGGVDRPVLAASHVPDEEADGVDALEGPRDELFRGQVVRGMVEAQVDRLQLLHQHADRVHAGQLSVRC